MTADVDGLSVDRMAILQGAETSLEQRRAATRTLASSAASAGELTEWMAMLGLDVEEMRSE